MKKVYARDPSLASASVSTRPAAAGATNRLEHGNDAGGADGQDGANLAGAPDGANARNEPDVPGAEEEEEVRPTGFSVRTTRTLHLHDDAQTEVQAEDTALGFPYGTSLIPFSQEDLQNMQYTCIKCLQVLGFTKALHVCRYLCFMFFL